MSDADRDDDLEAMQAIGQARAFLEQMASLPPSPAPVATSSIQPWKMAPQRAELRYRALVERIPAVTFMAELESGGVHELYVSPQIEQLLGFSQEEWLENPFLWYEQLHEDDRGTWAREFAAFCAMGSPFRSEYRLLTREGRIVWVHGECQIVRDETGRPLFLQGIAFDITASKVAEETLESRVRARTAELAESEGRMRAILETAVDGIITIDERGNILSFNPAATRLFGYPAEEVVGRNVNVLMPAPYHAEHDGYLSNFLHTGEKQIIGIGREVSGRRKDGTLFPMDLAVSETVIGPRRIFTGIVRDISQWVDAQKQLREAKDAAEVANQAKDHFLAVLSHELRTPLTPVLATVETLRRQQNLPAEFAGSMETIQRNIEMEARIIDDLLDLTRISRGKVELRLQNLDAHTSLRHALEVWQEQVAAKQVEVTLHLFAKQHHVMADPTRLQQIFWNLIGNAVKFTPENGRITLHSTNDSRGRLVVEIKDTGIGIAPDVLPRLFNAFEQGERTTTRRYGGLGLGLAITKSLLEMHGGTLVAASEGSGKGATFTLSMGTVPPVAAQDADKSQAQNPARTRLHVLLVEDHGDTLRAMVRLLRACGYEVSSASSVHEAIELARAEKFDVMISDLGLPDGSGLDLMRKIREIQPLRGIALSGFGMDEDIARSQEAGFEKHLTKPVNIDLLEKAIQSLMK